MDVMLVERAFEHIMGYYIGMCLVHFMGYYDVYGKVVSVYPT